MKVTIRSFYCPWCEFKFKVCFQGSPPRKPRDTVQCAKCRKVGVHDGKDDSVMSLREARKWIEGQQNKYWRQ